MDETPARRLPRHERRQQLLQTANSVFAERGYHATSMDDIAERSGVSKPVLYQHFKSKLELYLALVDEASDRLEAVVSRAVESTTANPERVEATLHAIYDFVTDPDGRARLVFESDLPDVDEVRRRTRGSLEAISEHIADLIRAETELEADEARLIAASLVGMVQMNARYWLSHPGALSKERAVELTTFVAWRGISKLPQQA